MVNKRLTEIANRHGSEKIPEERSSAVDIEGFTFIPDLGFYVADETSMHDENLYNCLRELDEKRSWMMTPVEFWKYYDFCMKNRMDIIESVKDWNGGEWLNGIMGDYERLVVGYGKMRGEAAKEYKVLVPRSYGGFDRKDIDPELGLPKVVHKDIHNREWRYKSPDSFETGICRLWEDCHILSLASSPRDSYQSVGVRECKGFV